jgi:hypothetical protein
MICQIKPVESQKESAAAINKGLIQARVIQARLSGRIIDAAPLGDGLFWSPLTAGPYLVPVSRWAE